MIRYPLVPAPLVGLALAASLADVSNGQATAPRPLGPTIASSPGTLGAVAEVVRLSDGRFVVNDTLRRQVSILSAQLQQERILIDSAPGRPNSYPTAAA